MLRDRTRTVQCWFDQTVLKFKWQISNNNLRIHFKFTFNADVLPVMRIIFRRHVLATLFQRYCTTQPNGNSMSTITAHFVKISFYVSRSQKLKLSKHTWSDLRSSPGIRQTADRVSSDCWIWAVWALHPWRFAADGCHLRARTYPLAPSANRARLANELPLGGSKSPSELGNSSTLSSIWLHWCHVVSPKASQPALAVALASPLKKTFINIVHFVN